MRLRVLTLNVWGLPLGLTRHHDARMTAIGKGFAASGADIIGLQEVWTSGARGILATAARRAGYSAIWHRPAAFGGSGLMVLSRLPIARHRFTRYRLAGLPQRVHHADYYGGKGFASLELTTADGPVTFIDTHLHAGYSKPGDDDEYLGIRAAQAIELAAHVRGLETPVIAAGDFNTSEGDDAYRIILELGGLGDAAVALDRRDPTCLAPHPYRNEDAEPGRIDLVLTRDGTTRPVRAITIERVFDERLFFGDEPGAYSDHAGILVELELGPGLAHRPRPARRPLDPDSLDHAARMLDQGAERTRQRQARELALAGRAGLGAGLLMGGAAWRARGGRRGFLTGLLAGLGGASGLAALAGGLGSRWVVADELAGFEEVRASLERLRADPPGPVSMRTP